MLREEVVRREKAEEGRAEKVLTWTASYRREDRAPGVGTSPALSGRQGPSTAWLPLGADGLPSMGFVGPLWVGVEPGRPWPEATKFDIQAQLWFFVSGQQ